MSRSNRLRPRNSTSLCNSVGSGRTEVRFVTKNARLKYVLSKDRVGKVKLHWNAVGVCSGRWLAIMIVTVELYQGFCSVGVGNCKIPTLRITA